MQSKGSQTSILIVALVSICIIPALAPVLLAISRPMWLWWCVGLGALEAFWLMRSDWSKMPEADFTSVLLACCGSIFPLTMAGLMWLMFAGFLWELYFVANLLFGWRDNASLYAPRLSLAVPILFGWAFLQLPLKRMPRQLAPESSFRVDVKRRGKWILVWLAVLIAAWAAIYTALFVWGSPRWFVWVLVEIGTLFATVWFWNLYDPRKQSIEVASVTFQEALDVTRRMFQALGYTVNEFANEGTEGGNPLLADLDLLAWRAENAFAVLVKAGLAPGTTVNWRSVAGMRAAASEAISRLDPNLAHRIGGIQYMVIFCGAAPDSTLKEYAAMQTVHLVEVPVEQMKHLAAAKDAAELQRAAEKYLPTPVLAGGGALSA